MADLTPKDKTKFHLQNKTNKTGFLGVTYKARDGHYVAQIRVAGRKEKVYCGVSKTAEGAARKYDAKAREIYGKDAVVNFPETEGGAE